VHQGWRINVQGIVQGVGFRPFVYRLAKRFGFTGSVANNAAGVQINLIATHADIIRFIESLQREAPPLAEILKVELTPQKVSSSSQFRIRDSDRSDKVNTLISPDIATCKECVNELFNRGDRRYLYPFINCTNCGPRFTIVETIPYDRPNTSMAPFTMCPQCREEYDDPENRRFHAQPNACPECGPHLLFYTSSGELFESDILHRVIDALKAGKIIAIKGLGGFHLVVDAENEIAVQTLRRRKHRFEKPLAVMVKDIEEAHNIVDLTVSEEKHLNNAIKPIVLCRKKEATRMAASLSLDNQELGIMLPYTPLHQVLFKIGGFKALVMTSANISEEPICYQNEETLLRLSNIADFYLMHNRDIYTRCDDSVTRIYRGEPFYIRRSRGYAPRPILIKKLSPQLLAVGGHLKNTVALAKDNRIFLSQHIGDLENLETLSFFEHTIAYLKKLFEIEPGIVLYDKHPEYLSTKWVKENITVPIADIQHHYAHILSVMAEKCITEPVIGIALDGTGFGVDQTIWGGEILICDTHTFRRFAHFETIPMPGGERAIKEPWRMAVAYLKMYCSNWHSIACKYFPSFQDKINIIGQQIDKKINTPVTSSCGRLFDIVAALLGLRDTVTYEGQAAILLESRAGTLNGKPELDVGSFIYNKIDEVIEISAQNIIERILYLHENAFTTEKISYAFHHALVDMFVQVVGRALKETGIRLVALSGGCFQNMLLLSNLYEKLANLGFTVYYNQVVPINDGGISLGQAYWGIYNYENVI
jgi:hydrogenase maturation protein HypF